MQKNSGEKEAVGDEHFQKLAAQIHQGHHQSCPVPTHTHARTQVVRYLAQQQQSASAP